MAQMLVPGDGAKGLDIETSSGVKKLEADRSGRINVDDPKLQKVLRAEGFTVAGLAATFNVDGYPCDCGHLSLFKVCGKCGKDNG